MGESRETCEFLKTAQPNARNVGAVNREVTWGQHQQFAGVRSSVEESALFDYSARWIGADFVGSPVISRYKVSNAARFSNK